MRAACTVKNGTSLHSTRLEIHYGNDRADSLANLGKGHGPFSRQLPIKVRLYGTPILHEEDDDDRDIRIQTGEGYPHPAVPGLYCCVWASDEQVQTASVAVWWGSQDSFRL